MNILIDNRAKRIDKNEINLNYTIIQYNNNPVPFGSYYYRSKLGLIKFLAFFRKKNHDIGTVRDFIIKSNLF